MAPCPGAQGDFRLEFDFQAIGGQSHFVYFRAQDLDNGYRLHYDRGSIVVARMEDGSPTIIGRSVITKEFAHTAWVRLVVDAVGDQIRVSDDETLLMRIPDGTYSSGKFFFSSINSTTYLDNLQVSSLDTIPRTSAASISLPFSTGFGEIAVRDGVLQHPNIDLLGGGIRYPEAAQREGTRGTVLSLGASTSTAELAGPGTLSDFRMEFDFRAVAGRSHSVYFRAQDLDNGYRLDYDDGSVALSRVVKGVGVAIGRSTIVNISVDDAWVRFVIEALSDDLRVLEDKTLLVGTTDGTYTPGKVFLSSADSTKIPHLDKRKTSLEPDAMRGKMFCCTDKPSPTRCTYYEARLTGVPVRRGEEYDGYDSIVGADDVRRVDARSGFEVVGGAPRGSAGRWSGLDGQPDNHVADTAEPGRR